MTKEKKPNQKQIDELYRQYERKAAFTLKQIYDDSEKKIRNIYIIFFNLVYIILAIIQHKHTLVFFAAFVVITLIAVISAKLLRNSAEKKARSSKAAQIERAEGYTQNLLDAFYTMPENPQYTVSSTIALIYTFWGNTEMALMELKKINPEVYKQKPDGAQLYYAALLIAQLLAGDLDHAADTYSKGFYYLNTYKASPISGPCVSLALGMYEYFCGRYDMSLQLIDIGIRAGYDDMRPENRIPDENMMTMLCYWKAVNLASMGNKAAAWDCINYCKNFYKTDYYRQCCEKLLADMAEKHRSEMRESAETLS